MDVSNPQAPREVGFYDTPAGAYCVEEAGGYAYVADSDSGLQIIEFYGAGMEESHKPQATSFKPGSSIVRGVLLLFEAVGGGRLAEGAHLLDIGGRKVLDLKPGANDVRAVAPGVYFVREEPQAASLMPQAVRKVVVTR